MCKKFRYKNGFEARKQIAWFKMNKTDTKECHFYKCSDCDGYHITSKKGRPFIRKYHT